MNFQRKEILTKNDLKLRLKFIINVQYATMKYEVIRKRVEVNPLKSK